MKARARDAHALLNGTRGALLNLSPTPFRMVSSYSAQTAAFAYSHMDPAHTATVFILGPSHHVHLRCADRSTFEGDVLCIRCRATIDDWSLGEGAVSKEVLHRFGSFFFGFVLV